MFPLWNPSMWNPISVYDNPILLVGRAKNLGVILDSICINPTCNLLENPIAFLFKICLESDHFSLPTTAAPLGGSTTVSLLPGLWSMLPQFSGLLLSLPYYSLFYIKVKMKMLKCKPGIFNLRLNLNGCPFTQSKSRSPHNCLGNPIWSDITPAPPLCISSALASLDFQLVFESASHAPASSLGCTLPPDTTWLTLSGSSLFSRVTLSVSSTPLLELLSLYSPDRYHQSLLLCFVIFLLLSANIQPNLLTFTFIMYCLSFH